MRARGGGTRKGRGTSVGETHAGVAVGAVGVIDTPNLLIVNDKNRLNVSFETHKSSLIAWKSLLGEKM